MCCITSTVPNCLHAEEAVAQWRHYTVTSTITMRHWLDARKLQYNESFCARIKISFKAILRFDNCSTCFDKTVVLFPSNKYSCVALTYLFGKWDWKLISAVITINDSINVTLACRLCYIKAWNPNKIESRRCRRCNLVRTSLICDRFACRRVLVSSLTLLRQLFIV